MKKYDYKNIEKKWQKKWEKNKLYQAFDNDKRKKYYCLDMFPYPSGEGLHVGHWRGYVLSDVISRYQMLNGKNVLHPMGWDAFGLPAENAAIKNKSQPKEFTKKAIKNIRTQIKQIGTMIDWSREINTSDPTYYKWTQWLFLKLYKNGLAYRKKAPVNWCPSCQTVLANEQVISSECERCGSQVTKKDLTQWFFKITDFAEDLLNDLEKLDWPERTKTLQRNWIGKSAGSLVRFEIKSLVPKGKIEIEVFTTRADTLFGCTYIVLSPEHELVEKLKAKCQNLSEIEDYVNKVKNKSYIERESTEKEKTGVELKGIKAVNPINNEQLPIFIADYVLPGYGTGTVMAVPAHDQRDFEFAKKYNLPIKQVIAPKLIQDTEPAQYRPNEPIKNGESVIVFVKHPDLNKYIGLDWIKDSWGAKTLLTGTIDDLSPEKTIIKEIREETGYLNPRIIKKLGVIDGLFYHLPKKINKLVRGHVYLVELENEEKVNIDDSEKENHLIKWLTINELEKFLTPLTHKFALNWLKNGYQPFIEDGVLLSSDNFDNLESKTAVEKITENLKEKGSGDFKTHYRLRDWLISRQRYWGAPIPIIYCDKCGEMPVPEKDLPIKLPEDVQFLPHGESPLKQSKEFFNTTCPKCKGKAIRETDTMDTFVCSSWYYLRYIDPKNNKDFANSKNVSYWLPVDTYVGGIEHAILHLLYARFISKALKKMGYINYPDGEPFKKLFNIGMIYLHGSKMSKSKGNIVSPDDLIEKYGTDALRGYELFIGPAELDNEWQINGISGIYRFIQKIWNIFENKIIHNNKPDQYLEKTIKIVTAEIENIRPNTAISHLMELFIYLKTKGLSSGYVKKINILLAPFFPHLAEELWQRQGNDTSIFLSSWSEYDKDLAKDIKLNIPVQINGKTRDIIEISQGTSKKEIEGLAKKSIKISKYLDNKIINNIIYIPGRIINFVVE